jgi:hypothetical protein
VAGGGSRGRAAGLGSVTSSRRSRLGG